MTDHVIGSSCDEAYLDVTNGLKLDGVKEVGIESENASIRGKAMAKFIQKHVTEKCKLKCSVRKPTTRFFGFFSGDPVVFSKCNLTHKPRIVSIPK